MNNVQSHLFKHPFTCMLAGPSKSGKTTLLKKILFNHHKLIDKPINKIIYCYSRWQNNFSELLNTISNIQFIQGLPEMDQFDVKENNLLILDDLMSECGKNLAIKEIFTIDSNHSNISVFFLTQNLFSNDKNTITISLNCNYMFIFNNPRDRAQFSHLSRQVFPENSKFLQECYYEAVENRGYLFLDFTQTANKNYRVQSDICFDDSSIIKRIIYIPKTTNF